MDDMINRHDSIAEENIEPNGRPAKNQFEEWSSEVTDRADNVFKDDTKDGPIKDREKRIKEMDEVILKSATKLFSVLLASKRPLITELADKLRLKYPLLPTISPCPTMRLEAIRSIIPISCRRYPKSV